MRLYFDFISHNAYLAWHALSELAGRKSVALELTPVLFAGLLKSTGMRGPAEVPPKHAWMLRNVLRKARHLGLPMQPPHSHPFNPLLPLRCCHAIEAGPDRATAVAALFHATWRDARDVTDAATVTAVLDAAGLGGEEIVARAGRYAAKTALKEATDAAIEAGVFGVPAVEVDGELFWGYDDLPWIEARLDGADPLDGQDLTAWHNVRPSASRL